MPRPPLASLAALAVVSASLAACCTVRAGRHGTPQAEVAQRLAEVRAKAPPGFTTLVAPPFVITGDGPPERVREDAEQVVAWAARRLQADYFPLDPGHLIEVWLFAGEESYLRNTSAIFGDVPRTPYGWYSPCNHALIMNVATGYGTLVHEMVHPFMEANFPDCPPWFNEGLASLYEQPNEDGGHLRGGTNWRLGGLQAAIWERRTLPLRELLALSRRAFYADKSGLHYAEARYLCHYLQEKGLLVTFYRRFVAAVASDPTGYATLQSVLGEPDMVAFQRRWEESVLLLSYHRAAR